MADRIGILSGDLWQLREELAVALGGEPVRIGLGLRGFDVALGWSDRRGGLTRRIAEIAGAPFRSVAIGPLRSVRPKGDPPMSLLFGAPGDEPTRSAERPYPEEIGDGLALLRRLRLAWRNDGRDTLPAGGALASPGRSAVLVVVRRQSAVWRRLAPDSATATLLIRQARRDNPDASILLVADAREPADIAKVIAAAHPGTVPIFRTNPWALFEVVSRVYAELGDLGMLARLANLQVASARVDESGSPPPESLFRSAFLDRTIWFDAWSRRPTDFQTAANQLAWLRDRHGENASRSIGVGVSGWKAASVARFLDGPDGPPIRVEGAAKAVARAVAIGGRIVAWETRMPARLPDLCRAADVPLIRMEDGFLRSVGLGAAFLPGASAVLDTRAIYYDPARESDLEHILATDAFPADLLARAAELRQRIVTLRLSKYNVGRGFDLADLPTGRQVVLVPGQVEDDASILLGARGAVRTNLGLLEAARRRNPDAILLWKPHPDVAAGLRAGAVDPATASSLADRVVSEASIADLLDRVDAVETMTSLTGFEALLRKRRVLVHGQPFYAGWGLTEDLDPPSRRTRRLHLDELVAASLILYPRYVDPITGLRCPPEILVERLASARAVAETVSPAAGAARMAFARLRHALLDPIALGLRRMRGVMRSVPRDPGA